ncbi:MAG: hypothetical protein Q9182_006066 [Xanthomendoza sp. 2 TL-2023]
MTDLASPRRALKELHVNSLRTPAAFKSLTSTTGNLKRSIIEVHDPASPPVASRSHLAKDASASQHDPAPDPYADKWQSPQWAPRLESEQALQRASREDKDITMVEEGTQETSSGNVSYLLDSDMEGCQTNPQQMAATDMSQSMQRPTLSVRLISGGPLKKRLTMG